MRTRGSLIFGSIFLMSIPGGDARAQAVVVAVAAAVGGFGGAVVGMLIGRNIKRWQSRYP